jgi:hypothetical protein
MLPQIGRVQAEFGSEACRTRVGLILRRGSRTTTVEICTVWYIPRYAQSVLYNDRTHILGAFEHSSEPPRLASSNMMLVKKARRHSSCLESDS